MYDYVQSMSIGNALNSFNWVTMGEQAFKVNASTLCLDWIDVMTGIDLFVKKIHNAQ